jgi:hypothetical protein
MILDGTANGIPVCRDMDDALRQTGISSDYLVDASPTAGACFLR